VGSGNFGGSRQQVAEGLASQAASQATGDAAAKVAQQLYQTNVDAQMKALGLVPQTQAAQVAPATTVSGVGDVQQAQQQAQLNDAIAKFYYPQYAGFLQSKDIMDLISGLPTGSQTVGSVTQPNMMMQTLGGAGSGAALGATLGSVVPGVGTAIGAGAGALGGAVLPWIFGNR
jgi:hypothetical protein